MGEQLNRVTLVDAHQVFTELMERVLDRHGYRCRTVDAGALSSEAIVRQVVASRPEVVVARLDLHSRHSHGAAVVRTLAVAGCRVLTVLEPGGPDRTGEALALGVYAVADLSMPLNEFLALVRKTMYGTPVISREERTRLVATYRGQQLRRMLAAGRLDSLSVQERKILVHLMAGRGVQEIATAHVVSTHTVRSQVRSVLGKLEVSSQIEAVALAWEAGWDRASGLPASA